MSDAYTFVKRRKVGNASAKLLLLVIAEWVDENGVTTPSSARLREDSELSARTVSTALELLEEQGVITRERTVNEKGRRGPDRITLVGFADWLSKLKKLETPDAKSASSEMHVQTPHVREIHVQDLHVQAKAQDVVSDPPEPTTSLPAKSAHAIRQEEINTSNVEEPLFLVEGAIPKRNCRAFNAEVQRVADELWFTWPPLARKRHTRAEVLAAVAAQLKANARPQDLITAGKRHVAERIQSGEGYVKGLVPFLAKGLWMNWMADDEPYAPPVDAKERERRLRILKEDNYWAPDWGPKPSAEVHA